MAMLKISDMYTMMMYTAACLCRYEREKEYRGCDEALREVRERTRIIICECRERYIRFIAIIVKRKRLVILSKLLMYFSLYKRLNDKYYEAEKKKKVAFYIILCCMRE